MNNTMLYEYIILFSILAVGCISLRLWQVTLQRNKAELQNFEMGQTYMFQEGTLLAMKSTIPMEWNALRQKSYEHAESFFEEHPCSMLNCVEQWAATLVDGYQGKMTSRQKAVQQQAPKPMRSMQTRKIANVS